MNLVLLACEDGLIVDILESEKKICFYDVIDSACNSFFLEVWLCSFYAGKRMNVHKIKTFTIRGMSCYSEHLGTNLNISQQERG